MEVRNNVSTQNFGAIMVPKNCQRRFMIAMREAYDGSKNNEGLLKCVQTLEKELSNKNHVDLRDVGYFAGSKCNGHWRAFVNDNDYWNTDTFFSEPMMPHKFLAKLSKKAGKGMSKEEHLFRDAQDCTNKAEILRMRKLIKEGKLTLEEQRDYLIGRIYELINFRPKA